MVVSAGKVADLQGVGILSSLGEFSISHSAWFILILLPPKGQDNDDYLTLALKRSLGLAFINGHATFQLQHDDVKKYWSHSPPLCKLMSLL